MNRIVLVIGLFLAIILGGLVGTMLIRDPGYVLISYADTVVETSLWVGLLLLAGIYLLLRGTTYLLRKITQSQSRVLGWHSGRKQRAARAQTVRGLLVMAEGRWAEAKKLFAGAAESVETPLINYLNAARAAHELGEHGERDEFLKKAHETTPGAKFAVTLTQAEFNIREGRYEQALAALLNLRRRAPKQPAVLSMLSKCYEALGDWQALLQLLGDISKYRALPEVEISRLEKAAWQAILQSDGSTRALWKKLPKALRVEMPLMRRWVTYLVEQERHDDAEQAIRLILAQQWDEVLVLTYGETHSTDLARQLVVAQSWAKERPNDAQVALTLGRLCLLNEKFAQARDYFEAALRLEPSDAVYGELGRLCIALGDERRGTEYLLHSLGNLSDLPQPQEPIMRKTHVS
jgi:HemY protein